jgi:hypothetical protein
MLFLHKQKLVTMLLPCRGIEKVPFSPRYLMNILSSPCDHEVTIGV